MGTDTVERRGAAFCAIAAGGAAAAVLLGSAPAWAWGHTGHLYVSEAAAQSLSREIPAFVRESGAIREVEELGAEADVSKGAGYIHDAERNPGHYIDIDDAGKVAGVSAFTPLAPTREAFDTAQRAGGQTQYSSGYLAYNIVDGWQQVRKDFGLYRALEKGLATAIDRKEANYFTYQLALRRKLILRDIGYWSHFIADGSQPLHVSVHFNGWGPYPNPNGYTTAPIHAPFEGTFVRDFVQKTAVLAAVRGYHDCACAIEQRVPQYLLATLAEVEPLYQLAAADPTFTVPRPAAIGFTTRRLAAGAAELRDEIVDAWRSSPTITVGYPTVLLSDILSGKVRMTPTTLASD